MHLSPLLIESQASKRMLFLLDLQRIFVNGLLQKVYLTSMSSNYFMKIRHGRSSEMKIVK